MMGELREYLATREERDERYYKALTVFHAKFSIPFACVALGILAVPLGIRSKSARRSFGIGLGIFFFLVYYLILSAGEVYGKMGIYPPVIGMWAPNIVLGAIGCFLLVRCARERGIGIGRLVHLLSRRSHSDSSPEESPSASRNP
jgi:lipopolysaccharide export system permease protein